MAVQSYICERFNIQVRLGNPPSPGDLGLTVMTNPRALGLAGMPDPSCLVLEKNYRFDLKGKIKKLLLLLLLLLSLINLKKNIITIKKNYKFDLKGLKTIRTWVRQV
jgi:hypothetical protein